MDGPNDMNDLKRKEGADEWDGSIETKNEVTIWRGELKRKERRSKRKVRFETKGKKLHLKCCKSSNEMDEFQRHEQGNERDVRVKRVEGRKEMNNLWRNQRKR